MIFSNFFPCYHEITSPQPLQIKQEPANEVNYYNPHVFNFDHVVHQVKQEVDQLPDDIVSASRGKSRHMRWTDQLHAMFVDVVDGLGGPWAARPRNIMKSMEHMGISLHQINSHLQRHRAKQAAHYPNDVGGRKPINSPGRRAKLAQNSAGRDWLALAL
ncbi:hypothetical protein HAX54_049355 [Datura stramonium]|uniref:HTH myb-type domain-containing protein n=1 Tax=Datura stramonium TaxID=4076 RepID=A0ABS8SVE2_DATST|nr:hypothetical protein [Datura stramonium]